MVTCLRRRLESGGNGVPDLFQRLRVAVNARRPPSGRRRLVGFDGRVGDAVPLVGGGAAQRRVSRPGGFRTSPRFRAALRRLKNLQKASWPSLESSMTIDIKSASITH